MLRIIFKTNNPMELMFYIFMKFKSQDGRVLLFTMDAPESSRSERTFSEWERLVSPASDPDPIIPPSDLDPIESCTNTGNGTQQAVSTPCRPPFCCVHASLCVEERVELLIT